MSIIRIIINPFSDFAYIFYLLYIIIWYRNPTPNQDEIADADRIEWKPTTDYPVDYMKIGERNIESGQFIKMESGLLQQRANFWMDLGINFGRERK